MKIGTHEKHKQLVIRGGVHKVERPKVINDAMLCAILQNGTFIMKIAFVVWFFLFNILNVFICKDRHGSKKYFA